MKLFSKLEENVLYFHGFKETSMNTTRANIFKKKNLDQNKLFDLVTLPPCRSVLQLHAKQANKSKLEILQSSQLGLSANNVQLANGEFVLVVMFHPLILRIFLLRLSLTRIYIKKIPRTNIVTQVATGKISYSSTLRHNAKTRTERY